MRLFLLAALVVVAAMLTVGLIMPMLIVSRVKSVYQGGPAPVRSVVPQSYAPYQVVTHMERTKPGYVQSIMNGEGINSLHEYTLEKPARVMRIVALGDSFTYGYRVPSHKSYPALLEGMLNERVHCEQYDAFEVMNFGFPGDDILHASERYLQKSQRYAPDLLVWLIKMDDVAIPLHIENYFSSILPGRSAGWFIGTLWPSLWPYSSAWAVAENAVFKVVRHLQHEAFLLYLPPGPHTDSIAASFAREIVAKESTVQVYESPARLLSQDYQVDSHPTPTGYEKIAADLFSHLLTHQLSGCSVHE